MDEIEIAARDPRIGAMDDRAAIHAAIQAAADEHGGMVHIADVRAHLTREVNPVQIGATICALVREGVLVGTGAYRPNGQRGSRNATKPAEVRLLVGALT